MSSLVGIVLILITLVGSLIWGLRKDSGEIVPLTDDKRMEQVDSSEMVTEKDQTLFMSPEVRDNKGRIEFTDEEMRYLDSQPISRFNKDTLQLIGQIKPLEFEGHILQASGIYIKRHSLKTNRRVYISYSTRGEKYLGAVQILEVKKKYTRLDNFYLDQKNRLRFDPKLVPEVVQTVIFKNFDINTIHVRSNKLFLGGGTSDPLFKTPAVLEIINLNDGLISKNPESKRVDLPSYTVTSVIAVKKKIYAATGDRYGGVVELPSAKSLKNGLSHFEELPYRLYEIDDVRDLAFDKENIYAVKGTDAGLWILSRTDNKSEGKLINLSGATIPESKSTIELTRDSIILALGDGGTQIIDKKTFNIKAVIPQANHYKNNQSLSVTNAASGRFRELYVADGEAGARVFSYDPKNKNFTLSSKITFGDGKSVNEIKYVNGFLIIANGMDGVKIARLFRRNKATILEEAKYYDEFNKETKSK